MTPRKPTYQAHRGERQEQRILALLAGGPMSASQISEKLFLSQPRVNAYLQRLRASPRRIYVAKHGMVFGSGRPNAMYAPGNFPDAAFKRKSKIKGSRYDQQMAVVIAFLATPATSSDIAKHLQRTQSAAMAYIRDLRKQKRVYIADWRHPGKQGPRAPIYALGNKSDVPTGRTTRAEIYASTKADPEKHQKLLTQRRLLTLRDRVATKPNSWIGALLTGKGLRNAVTKGSTC